MNYSDLMTIWYLGIEHALNYSKGGGKGLLRRICMDYYGDSHAVTYGPEVLGVVLPGELPNIIIDQMIGAPLERFAQIDFDDSDMDPGAQVLRGANILRVQILCPGEPCTVIFCSDAWS